MTTYEVDQLVVLVETRRVEARSPAEAIVKIYDGEAQLVDINVADRCDERGLPADDYPALVKELREAGVMADEKVIPSISRVEKVGGPRFTMPADAEVAIRFSPAE